MMTCKKLNKFEQNQLKIGKKIEREHTKNPYVAEKIALDHIKEFKNKPYYTELVKMEKRLMKKKSR